MEKRVEASQVLAHYVAGLKYEDIPPEVRDRTKVSILDTIGVTMAASTLGLGHRQLVELIKEGGGKGESAIMGFGDRVPVWMAALANGAMARAVNFDDNHDESSNHPSSLTVPAAMAMAQRIGDVSGKELITAVTVGNEITCRLGLSISQSAQGTNVEEWFLTSVHGIFGATAACCRLLRLDESRIQNAFGIALFQSSGTAEAYTPSGQSTMMRGMITGFTSQSAVLSALMAEKDITGVPESLEGKAGLYRVYFKGDYNREALLGDLGKRFACGDIAIKPFPTCRYTHSYIDATLQLARKHDITADQIKQIRIFVAGFVQTKCEPLERQRHPVNFNDAGHALPYLVAVAATKKRIQLKDLTSDLQDPLTLRTSSKVVPVYDERFDILNRIGPAMVEIELTNGTLYSKEVQVAPGHPKNPLSLKDVTDKFRDCVSHSIKPLSNEDIKKLIEMVADIERVDNVGEIFRFLA